MIIFNDFKTTGKRRLFIAKEQFSSNLLAFAIKK